MTIKEVEELTGLTRSNIRFYEKEGLFEPTRNANGYREYSQDNVEEIKKIAYLRTLGLSIEDIRALKGKQLTLREAIRMQENKLSAQLSEVEAARAMCRQMLDAEQLDYEHLKAETYVKSMNEYFNANKELFKFDSVSFFYLWQGTAIWGLLVIVSLVIALLAYPQLPPMIPVQWSHGEVSSTVGKWFIFVYPILCILFRLLLRPFIWRWLYNHAVISDEITDYLANFLCFVILSVEVFMLLFIHGWMHNILIVLLVDLVLFIGLLVFSLKKRSEKYK